MKTPTKILTLTVSVVLLATIVSCSSVRNSVSQNNTNTTQTLQNKQTENEIHKEDFTNKDFQRALPWLIEMAEENDVSSMSILAQIYRFGKGIEKDYQQAFYWQKRLVENNGFEFQYIDNQLTLSAMYYCGMGTEKNSILATYWLEQNPNRIMNSHYIEYAFACHATDEYELALNMYQKAFDDGDATVGNALARMYIDGKGTKKNYTKAMEIYKEAYAKGNLMALVGIGDMYENGEGVPVDYNKAKEYYLQAEAEGEVFALVSMAQLYRLGRGVDKNLSKSKEYYTVACADLAPEVCEYIQSLKSPNNKIE